MNTANTILKTTAQEYLQTKAPKVAAAAAGVAPNKKSDAAAAAKAISKFNTSLHARLISLTEQAAGFAASEVTGYSAAQVRKAAEGMAETGLMLRWNVSPRRVRYFANEDQAKNYKPTPVAGRVAGPSSGPRMKAGWAADEPAIITSQTKITIAPRLPSNVYRSNTYLKF